MIKYDKSIYESFNHTMGRAQAMLKVQSGMNKFKELISGEKSITEAFNDAFPSLAEPIEAFNDISQSVGEEVKENIDENKYKKKIERVRDSFEEVDQKQLEKEGKPLVDFFQSLDTLCKEPLYKEAVVTSVTGFETYLKDRLIDLVIKNRSIERKFSPQLKEGLNYEKVKKFNRDWEKLLGYVVLEGVGSFFDVNNIDKIYRRVFGKKKDDNFSFFSGDRQRKMLRNYIELRHIIVHNSGIVDHKFYDVTNGRYKLDEPFLIKSRYVKTMIGSMKKVIDKIESEIDHYEGK